ncbi:hypothetical protein ACQEVZ_40780 [Dactylosporangium sp. CA-152071]|uniref:hypothetical protein n=1 Tax=Dactylosporangium sp. CA-152071 TaxID=3239933 RepID=UPI003D93B3FB
MTLGPYAQRLLQAMTGPAPDDPRFTGEPPDLSRVGDEELGALFVAAWQVAAETTQGATQGATQETAPAAVTAAGAVRLAVQERSPAFTPAVCADLFHTIAERGFSPGVAVAAVLRCTGPLPPDLAAPAAVLARDARGFGRLVLAALAGPAVDAAVSAGVRADLAGDPLAAAEVEEVLALDVAGRAVVAEADRHRDVGGVAALPDIIDRLAGLPGYVPFARIALETAGARIADIHSGRTAYAADKAFTPSRSTCSGGRARWRCCGTSLGWARCCSGCCPAPWWRRPRRGPHRPRRPATPSPRRWRPGRRRSRWRRCGRPAPRPATPVSSRSSTGWCPSRSRASPGSPRSRCACPPAPPRPGPS